MSKSGIRLLQTWHHSQHITARPFSKKKKSSTPCQRLKPWSDYFAGVRASRAITFFQSRAMYSYKAIHVTGKGDVRCTLQSSTLHNLNKRNFFLAEIKNATKALSNAHKQRLLSQASPHLAIHHPPPPHRPMAPSTHTRTSRIHNHTQRRHPASAPSEAKRVAGHAESAIGVSVEEAWDARE